MTQPGESRAGHGYGAPKPAVTQEWVRALQDSAAWLRITLTSIGDGVITTDGAGRVTMLNPVAQRLTGWTQEAAASRLLTEVFHIINQDTRAEVENPALRALRDGLIVGLANHTLLIARDGVERNIDDSAAPIRNDKGEVAGAILVFRDITERYKQERLIIDGRAFAESILNTLPHAFLVLDKDLGVISANPAWYRGFGTSEAQTLGRKVYELLDGRLNVPSLRGLLEELLPGTDRTIEAFKLEGDFAGVGPRVLSLNARRVHMPGTHSELLLLVLDDITAYERARETVHESEVRYRRLFQAAKDGILILDAVTGKIIDANAFMSGLTGMAYDELLGKELHEIGLFQDIEENKRGFVELQTTGYLRREHLPIRNQRGERVEIEMIANVYREGAKTVAQCNIRDISQRVAMEKKIAEQAEALASESRRKDEFLAMLSHELRNPLAPIRSAVHLLRTLERPGGENLIQKQAHEIIERQVASLTKLVSDLLEVSRVVSGRVRLNQQIVDLNRVVSNAVETVTPIIEQRRHTLVTHPCPDAAWVTADSVRMEEVFINLLQNAAKYTPDGGRIDIHCGRPPGASFAQVRILDNGVGIEAHLLPRIFDLFTQADRSLDRAAGGLGIGLSLAHRLVDLHGGTIEAHSPPHGAAVGSEFVVKLPLAVPPLSALPDALPESPPRAGTQRILLVDDNIDLVMMLASSLRHRGHSVQAAYTGPDGLKIAALWRPDVVLLDIGLPGLDGYEVARRLRSDPALTSAAMRIFALTGYGRESDVALAREAGFDGHLIKPVKFQELERMISPVPASPPTVPS